MVELHGDIHVELRKAGLVLEQLEGVEEQLAENIELVDQIKSCRHEFKAAVLGLEVSGICQLSYIWISYICFIL